MKVLKFGGSSVGTPQRIQSIIGLLKERYVQGEHFSVVFSAFSGVTDSLLEMARRASNGDPSYAELFDDFKERHHAAASYLLDGEALQGLLGGLSENTDILKNLLYGVYLLREASPRTQDYIVSFGERTAAFIIAGAMRHHGIAASYLDARKVIRTDHNFGAAIVDFEMTNHQVSQYFDQHPDIQVITGFIGSTENGLTTTLGRGGSDYSAAILAAALGAEALEIWTDVDGVLTADPRRVKKAFSIPTMTYAEAMEMSHFGAKVIYPPTIQPALQKGIPIIIKNTFNPSHPGTFISGKADLNGRAVKGISSIGHVALLTLSGGGLFGVPGIAGRLFNALAQSGVNIILITQGSSEHSISFAVEPRAASMARRAVEKAFEYEMSRGIVDPVKVEDQLSVVAIIGENMRYRPGISGRLFQALGKNGVNVVAIAQGSSELNISVVIHAVDETKALNAMHEAFFLSDTKELHLFMIGVGLIGSTLINQIHEQTGFLKEKRALEIKIVGLANTRKMIFNEEGIDLKNWKALLDLSESETDIPVFIEKMKTLNLSNTIFVDNTADEKVAVFYEKILESSISISTPNKIATSSSYLQYERLKKIASKRGVQFLYETNVGAGLPVISTLNDLIISGDRILKIEGVMSGSLSFIFNTFSGDRPFSQIVRQAREMGFTEPDPRIDLSGQDVRRKLVILARETGLPMEPKDVQIESILPQPALEADTVEDFFSALEEADAYFETLRKDSAAAGKVMRMVAKLEDGQASIGLQTVDASHPFFGLNGSDNMIVFTTERYKDRPLVVRGPGAGAEVTAAGVFAEIVRIGNFLS